MIIFLAVIYKDIEPNCYSSNGKTLNQVTDTSNHLRISAACEYIKDNCFYKLYTLFSFTFQENSNLTSIGFKSFYECKNLTSIDLSSCTKLKKISMHAFSYCEKVSSILLPKGVTELQSSAFSNIKETNNVIIPASIEILGDWAFSWCTKLSSVTFEEGSNLTSLNYAVFRYDPIISFEIPEKVSKVNGLAFENNYVSSITLNTKNEYLKIVDNTVFSKNMSILYFFCKKPTPTYEVPNYVTTLGESLFEQGSLSTITIPNSVITIESKCFYGSRIKEITFPESLKSIGYTAFYSCSYLKNATFLGTLDYIAGQIFDYCKNMELIVFPDSNMIVNTYMFCTSASPKIFMNFTHKTLFSSRAITRVTNISISYMNRANLVIDSNALIMDDEQTKVFEFWGLDHYEITIPKTVTKIRERVFENSTIYKINFEEGSQLSQIYNYAFMNCSKIYSFNFSSTSLSIIGMFSFKDCINLSRVIFPSTNFQIMNNVFENCINLTNVINITNISDSCFSGCYRLCNVEIREGSEIIGVRAFDHCNSLESINIPSSVKIISDYAFINCDKLKSINFTEINNLENFSINSISNCQSLSNISRFSSDKYICDYNTIYYKNNSDSKQYLIYHLSHSQDIVVFIKCNTICQYSFNHSNNIENISISNNSVSLIESFSFNKCLNLKYINFPLSVELVSRFAFHECKSIRCPIIDNRSPDFIRMISNSGISKTLMISCHIVHVTHKVQNLERICNHSLKLKIFMRNLINKC